MATLFRGYTFGSIEQVTAAKLHALVDSGTITGIVNADIDNSAAIAYSKLADIDGSKLTGLANIAIGAGKIPSENLPIVDTYAAKGANSDITSLAGLTTPLSIAQGGTASASAANARTALGLAIGTDVLAPNGDGSGLSSVPSRSNVIFEWHGMDSRDASAGILEGTSLTPAINNTLYHFLGKAGTSYQSVLTGKFTKIAGISTITIHAKLWANTNNSYIQVNIGGQVNNVDCYVSAVTTPTWATPQTIDVSGLTNGTTYNITVSLKNNSSGNSVSYCSNVMLIAS
jgi:hypothetical protein